MREDLLHFVWKHQKLPLNSLQTTRGNSVYIENHGQHNFLAGPDFFNAKLTIDGQLWAGNVELHIKASDWYVHGHEKDANYDNVILHVVWEDDVSVFRKDGSEIPTLQLQEYISKTILNGYQKLLNNSKTKFINCENDFGQVDVFLLDNWLERIYFERLEQKSKLIFELLDVSKNDWEKVLFCLLMKNFGLNLNGEAFLEIAKSIDYSIFRKVQNNALQLEALLFGVSGLLDDEFSDGYPISLKREYDFLKNKFELVSSHQKLHFYGLRPNNFPTIRLSQIACLYHNQQGFFNQLMQTGHIEKFYSLFAATTTEYWQAHYTFDKISKKSEKKLTKNFIDLLLINTIAPLKFAYGKFLGKDLNDEVMNILLKIKPEKNSIIKKFDTLGHTTRNALYSQAKIQLYNEYCSKNQCLQCAVGAHLLNRNT